MKTLEEYREAGKAIWNDLAHGGVRVHDEEGTVLLYALNGYGVNIWEGSERVRTGELPSEQYIGGAFVALAQKNQEAPNKHFATELELVVVATKAHMNHHHAQAQFGGAANLYIRDGFYGESLDIGDAGWRLSSFVEPCARAVINLAEAHKLEFELRDKYDAFAEIVEGAHV